MCRVAGDTARAATLDEVKGLRRGAVLNLVPVKHIHPVSYP